MKPKLMLLTNNQGQTIKAKQMRPLELTKPVYSFVGTGCEINYSTNYTYRSVLNFIGAGWVDVKFGLVKQVLPLYRYIATDTDLVAHEDYRDRIAEGTTVIFLANVSPTSASKNRIKNAMAILKAKGIKCRYFVSQDAFDRFINKFRNI